MTERCEKRESDQRGEKQMEQSPWVPEDVMAILVDLDIPLRLAH